MGLVEPVLDGEPRGLHLPFVRVGRNADEIADNNDRRPNGNPSVARSQVWN